MIVPLVSDQMIRSRWASDPIPSVDGEQDTDPTDDLAEMALSELSETSQGTLAVGDAGNETSKVASPLKAPPPPPLTVTEQFSRVGHLPVDEPTFTLTRLLVTGMVCMSIGLVLGFAAAWYILK